MLVGERVLSIPAGFDNNLLMVTGCGHCRAMLRFGVADEPEETHLGSCHPDFSAATTRLGRVSPATVH